MLKGERPLISNLPKPRPDKPGIAIFQQFDGEMDRRPTMRLFFLESATMRVQP